MFKKWQCLGLMSSILVSAFTIFLFVQPATAKTSSVQQSSGAPKFGACLVTASEPRAFFGEIRASGEMVCARGQFMKVNIVLIREGLERSQAVAFNSEEARGGFLRVSVSRGCAQSGFYRTRVTGYTWDFFFQRWRPAGMANSDTVRLGCFFRP